jgi:hypothetical protein
MGLTGPNLILVKGGELEGGPEDTREKKKAWSKFFSNRRD